MLRCLQTISIIKDNQVLQWIKKASESFFLIQKLRWNKQEIETDKQLATYVFINALYISNHSSITKTLNSRLTVLQLNRNVFQKLKFKNNDVDTDFSLNLF